MEAFVAGFYFMSMVGTPRHRKLRFRDHEGDGGDGSMLSLRKRGTLINIEDECAELDAVKSTALGLPFSHGAISSTEIFCVAKLFELLADWDGKDEVGN